MLEAPRKEIIWLEHLGHSPWLNKSERFVEEVVSILESGN